MSWTAVPLDAHLNAHAATWNDERAAATLNAWGNTFPAEELPFGETVELGGIPYRLPRKRRGGFDHVEALGQRIALTSADVDAIAVLCFGEMGDQRLRATLHGSGGSAPLQIIAPGWLVPHDVVPGPGALACRHLHYGGYELDLLRPSAWSVRHALPRAMRVDRLELAEQPLVHVFAITLHTVEKEA